MKKLRYIYRLLILGGIAVVMLCCCGKQTEECAYTVQREGNLGKSAGYTGVCMENINQEYACMVDNTNNLEGYDFSLENFYYDSVSGIVVYAIRISYEGSDVTDNQYQTILQEYNNSEIRIAFPKSSQTCQSELKREKNGTFIYGSVQVSMFPYDEKTDDNKAGGYLEKMYLRWKDKEIDFVLPQYCRKQRVVHFDTSASQITEGCILSEQSLNILWNLEPIMDEFEKEMREKKEEQGKYFDEEEYDYEVCSEIELIYKDGGRRSIVGGSKHCIEIENSMEENREHDKLGNLRAFFAEKIDIDNVKEIVIDGNVCPVTFISN